MRFRILKSQNVKTVPGEMSNIDVDMISLVRKGANRQKIQIYKSEEEPSLSQVQEPTSDGFFQVLKEYFLGGRRIEKGAEIDNSTKNQVPTVKNFKTMMAVNDLTSNMWRVNDTLSTVLRDILNNPSATDKKTLMEEAIEQYADYMKSKINAVKIEKSDPFFSIEIEKAGKAISTGNMEKIKAARSALDELIAATTPSQEEEKEKEEEEVKKSEVVNLVTEAINKAMKPYEEQISKMEQENSSLEGAGENEIGDTDLSEIVSQAVQKAMEPMAKRIETIEKSRGIANSQLDLEHGIQKQQQERSTFDGMFI